MNDHEIAGLLAQETGEVLVNLRARCLAEGGFSHNLRRMGDQIAHRHLVERLTSLRPEDKVLSEEGVDNPSRLKAKRVWIVDPLDGTQDYGRQGSLEWAVHVALAVNGRSAAAAVALPAFGALYGTLQDRVSGSASSNDQPVVITSRSQWGEAEKVAAAIGGVVRNAGSAGVKAMAVVAGSADVYVHPSGLYEWDACAPAGVAIAAGLDVSGVDGSALVFNKPLPVVPGLLVSRPEYTVAAQAALCG